MEKQSISCTVFIGDGQEKDTISSLLSSLAPISVDHTVRTHAEAVSALGSAETALLFTDCAGLRALGNMGRPPFTVCIAAEEDKLRIAEILHGGGVFDVLTAPFSETDVLNVVSKVLHIHNFYTKYGRSPYGFAGIDTAAGSTGDDRVCSPQNGVEHMFVREPGKRERVKVHFGDILFVRKEGDCVCISLSGGGSLHARASVSGFLQRLPGGNFARVNRSAIVNTDHVTGADAAHVLIGGTAFPVTRVYRQQLKRRLDIR